MDCLEHSLERIRNHYKKTVRPSVWSHSYRRILGHYLRYIIPEKVDVLEVGCGEGGLFEELPNRHLHGLDLCAEQVERAQRNFPSVELACGSGETAKFERSYDYILLSDTLNEAADVQRLLKNLLTASTEKTRLVVTTHNTLWKPVLGLATYFGWKPRRPEQNWLSDDDVLNLLHLGGWDIVRREHRVLIPHELFGLGTLVNRYLAPLLSCACLSHFFIARPRVRESKPEWSVSVVIPARNEAGNIEAAVARVPQMGRSTEIIFVEGHSSDGTFERIKEAAALQPEKNIRYFQQAGTGKGDAMRLGYEHATGEVIMILDADLTVAPEDLPKFFEAIASGDAEFINGVRLVYPLEDEAMRFLNMCGNKFFSLLFSWFLNIPIKDTLCGTKVFTREHYQIIEANRAYFGDFDPFGDFDLIFGAAKSNLKIRDIPVRYFGRRYGEPQIDRWRDGILLIRMAIFAARKIKFI